MTQKNFTDTKPDKEYLSSGSSSISNRAFTIPNLLCLIRILLITPFVEFFLDERYITALLVIAVSGLTDCFDGMIARKFNQESELGKILDPLADKLTLLAVGICLCVIEPFFLPVVFILVIKDILMLIGSSRVIKKGIIVPKSKWYGKLGTVMFYITVVFIVFTKTLQTFENPIIYINKDTANIISMIMLCLTAAVMIFAFVMYSITYRDIMNKADSTDENSASITE